MATRITVDRYARLGFQSLRCGLTIAALLSASICWAQYSGGSSSGGFGGSSGSSGGFGGSSGSSGGFGGSSGSSGGFGSSSGSSSGSSGGLFGNRQLGGTLSAGNRSLTGSNAPSLQNIGNNAGQLTGSERFVRGNRQSGQFVGGDQSTSPTNFLSALGNNQQNNNNRNLRNNQQSRPQSANQQDNSLSPKMRVTYTSAIELPASDSVKSSTDIASRLNKSSQLKTKLPFTVSIQEGTAILRGVVASPHDRALAERVVLLEPGISMVQNEIEVVAPVPKPSSRP